MLGAEENIARKWLDVEVPELQPALPLNWVWTVVGPKDSAEIEDEFDVVMDHDVEEGWTPNRISAGLEKWVRQYTGRNDITFVWDSMLRSPMATLIEARASEFK